MAEWTVGVAVSGSDERYNANMIYDDQHAVCSVFGVNLNRTLSEAIEDAKELPEYKHCLDNAYLLSAAKELLAMCEFMSKYFNMRQEKGDPLPCQLVDAVRAAIAKAKGES